MSSPNQAATSAVSATQPTHASTIDVVQRHPRSAPEAEALAQPRGDQPGPQHVLHRLAHAQVGRQRERGHELGQPHPRILITRVHSDHGKRSDLPQTADTLI